MIEESTTKKLGYEKVNSVDWAVKLQTIRPGMCSNVRVTLLRFAGIPAPVSAHHQVQGTGQNIQYQFALLNAAQDCGCLFIESLDTVK